MYKSLLIALSLTSSAVSAQQIAPATLAPNMTFVAYEAMTVTAISNPAAVLQYGWVKNTGAATYGPTFTPKTLPLYVNYTNYLMLGGVATDAIAGSPGSGLWAQETTAPYTISYNNGATYAVATIPAIVAPAPPPPSTTCAGEMYEIGGGTAGMSATLPTGTTYQLGSGACTTAAATVTLDLSAANLGVAYTFVAQSIVVTKSGVNSTVTIPALFPVSIINIQFDTVDATGRKMHCTYVQPGTAVIGCRLL